MAMGISPNDGKTISGLSTKVLAQKYSNTAMIKIKVSKMNPE